MSKLPIRIGNERGWLVKSDYQAEKELQEMIYENPSVIPFEDIDPKIKSQVRVAIKEVDLDGYGEIDLLLIDDAANIYIIETKLATNDEVRRKVIGQILEYAALLSEKGSEWLEEKFKEQKGKDFSELLGGKMKENFRESIEQKLAKGDFILLIATDKINEKLRSTVEFLKGKLGIEISVIELRYYKEPNKEIDVLVPTVFSSKKQPEVMRNWDERSFFEDAEDRASDELIVETLRKVYQSLDGLRPDGQISFGRGREATFQLRNKFNETLLVIKSSGKNNWFNFGGLIKRGVSADIIKSYIIELKQIGFTLDQDLHFNRYPTFDIILLSSDDKVAKFKDTTSKFLKETSNRA